jgi:hypothetical protein
VALPAATERAAARKYWVMAAAVLSIFIAMAVAGIWYWRTKASNIAYQQRGHLLYGLRTDFAFDFLRSDPRYAELVRRIGLPQ